MISVGKHGVLAKIKYQLSQQGTLTALQVTCGKRLPGPAVRATGNQLQGTGNESQDTGNQLQETGSQPYGGPTLCQVKGPGSTSHGLSEFTPQHISQRSAALRGSLMRVGGTSVCRTEIQSCTRRLPSLKVVTKKEKTRNAGVSQLRPL